MMKPRTKPLTKADMLLLNSPMLNEKKLADCTGEECAQFADIFERFAAEKIPPRNSRGEVLPISPAVCAFFADLFRYFAVEVGPNKVGDVISKYEAEDISADELDRLLQAAREN